MRRALLDYDLPPELIADRPPDERDGARLLVMRAEGSIQHARVRDLDTFVEPGTLVVVNDTRVIPARLLGHREPTGGKVEILLVRRIDDRRWRALGRASKALREGTAIAFDGGVLRGEVTRGTGADGLVEVALLPTTGLGVDEAIEASGHVPLPPYVRRPDDAADRERYQTVFARVPGAVAAPTAGLHLSHALLDRIRARGASVATVTLHVGLGTFQPVSADDLDDHPMHSEIFSVPEETAAAVTRARSKSKNAAVLAVGTTVVRALESAADPERPGHVRAAEGETRLLIQPGYRFQVVDQLLTNFHLPQSTLLALVSAFAGRERVLAAYRTAVAERYRFFSYGDAMFLGGRTVA